MRRAILSQCRSTSSWPAADEVLRVRRGRGPRSALTRDRARAARVGWMTPRERARFDRFRHDADRAMFALGRLMARTLVGRALGVDRRTAWAWREGPHGRPEIDRPTRTCTSTCRTARAWWFARWRAAASRRRGRRRSGAAPRPIAAIVPRYCSPAEADDVACAGRSAGAIDF